jgi:hypothetical protein
MSTDTGYREKVRIHYSSNLTRAVTQCKHMAWDYDIFVIHPFRKLHLPPISGRFDLVYLGNSRIEVYFFVDRRFLGESIYQYHSPDYCALLLNIMNGRNIYNIYNSSSTAFFRFYRNRRFSRELSGINYEFL